MPGYLIHFNQQWVGDHTEEWFRGRGPLAMAVVRITDGPFVETKEYLGGLTIVDVADEAAARMWAGKVAEACGWPQEVRRFKSAPRVAQPG